jgi:hypothetical protein
MAWHINPILIESKKLNEKMGTELNNSYSDYTIDQIKWNEDGTNLLIQLSFETKLEELCFVGVSNLIINFEYKDYVGKALIFQIDFKKLEDKEYEILINASPMGSITLKCNSIQIMNKK